MSGIKGAVRVVSNSDDPIEDFMKDTKVTKVTKVEYKTNRTNGEQFTFTFTFT